MCPFLLQPLRLTRQSSQLRLPGSCLPQQVGEEARPEAGRQGPLGTVQRGGALPGRTNGGPRGVQHSPFSRWARSLSKSEAWPGAGGSGASGPRGGRCARSLASLARQPQLRLPFRLPVCPHRAVPHELRCPTRSLPVSSPGKFHRLSGLSADVARPFQPRRVLRPERAVFCSVRACHSAPRWHLSPHA